MKTEEIFDLASLAKPLVTVPLVFDCLDLNLDLTNYIGFKEFKLDQRKLIVRQLISHCAGLPPWLPFDGISPIRRLSKNTFPNRHPLLKRPAALGDKYPSVYSDIGYYILALGVEYKTGGDFCFLCKEKSGFEIAPWTNNVSTPPYGPDRIAWELAGNLKRFPEQKGNMPHDANARAGMYGHAGLAASSMAMKKWLEVWRFEYAPRMVTPESETTDKTIWGLGLWKVWSGDGYFGELLDGIKLDIGCVVVSNNTTIDPELIFQNMNRYYSRHWWMHTGFTGPSIFYRPSDRSCICLLTNRLGENGRLLSDMEIYSRRYHMLKNICLELRWL